MWLDFLGSLAQGLGFTIAIFLGATAVTLVSSLLAGAAQISSVAPLRWLSIAYVEVFRGVSPVVWLFWFYFALPFVGMELNAFVVGILGLGLYKGAYGAEVVKGVLHSFPRSQLEAIRALNIPSSTGFFRVVLPQAVVTMIPPMTNIVVDLLMATSLVSLISVSDLTFRVENLRISTGNATAAYLAAMAIYFLLAKAVAAGCELLRARLSVSVSGQSGS